MYVKTAVDRLERFDPPPQKTNTEGSPRLCLSPPLTPVPTMAEQLLAHESIGANISDLDQGPLSHLLRLEVVDVEGTQQDYRVDFVSGVLIFALCIMERRRRD